MHRPDWKNVIGASIFGLIVAGLGLWGILSNAGRVYYAYVSKEWPAVSGIVVKSAVVDDPRSREWRREQMQGDYRRTLPMQGEEHRLDFRYRYTVDGREYHCDRVAFSFSASGLWLGPIAISNPQKNGAAVVAQYPAGTNVTVHYQPGNPARATLRTGGFTGQYVLFAFLCLPVLLFGCLIVLHTWIGPGSEEAGSRTWWGKRKPKRRIPGPEELPRGYQFLRVQQELGATQFRVLRQRHSSRRP